MEVSCDLFDVVIEYGAISGRVKRVRQWKDVNLSVDRFQLILNVDPLPISYDFKNFSAHTNFASQGKLGFRFLSHDVQVLIRGDPLSVQLLVEQGSGKSIRRKEPPRASSPPPRKPERPPLVAIKRNLNHLSPPAKPSKQVRTSTSPPSHKSGKLPQQQEQEQQRTAEQTKVLEAIKNGVSVFFTGGAGTGKTFLLKQVIQALPPATTFVTASTGLAACHISGTTINCFAGIGRADLPLQTLISKASKPRNAERWKKAKVLIIDEVSMLDGKLFDTLEQVARAVRKNDRPFGGIQLVLSGDFFQLPPVSRNENDRKFCFEAKAWSRCAMKSFVLSEVFRQRDINFVSLLNSLRIGQCTREMYEELHALTRKRLPECNGIVATKLLPHRTAVDQINTEELVKLDSESVIFDAVDEYVDPTFCNDSELNTVCPAKTQLELKVGAQVILLKTLSISDKLVNGSRGVITKFTKSPRLPVITFMDGSEHIISRETWTLQVGGRLVATRTQFPLDLAWALSIHKSQGMTLDRVEISLSKAFEYGQAYVALSRARSLEGVAVLGSFEPTVIKAHPKVLTFYEELSRKMNRLTISP